MDVRIDRETRLLNAAQDAIRAVRAGGPEMVLMLMGLGRIDFVLCTLGTEARKTILNKAADRVRDFLPGSFIQDVWGDRLGIVAPCPNDPGEMMNLAQRVVALSSVPHRVDGQEVFCPPFIGVAMIRPDYPNAAALLQDAMSAMEDARRAHLGNARLFDPERQRLTFRTFEIENVLRAAFETGNQFHVVYQPLVSLNAAGADSLLGFEALCRWNHPVLGAISPDEFIPVSEECGLILGLGNYVLWESCRQQVQWQALSGRPVSMSVNLSPVQLMSSGIEDTIAEAVAETGIRPECLKLEVTETALALNPPLLADKLRRIKAMGIAIGVDDFGSGYSSLGQLDLFGLDFMKIDKSLIQRLGPGGRQTALVGLTIALAKTLGMMVVAEGIEDHDHLEALRGLGIDVGQGYLFARPLAPPQAEEWVTRATPA